MAALLLTLAALLAAGSAALAAAHLARVSRALVPDAALIVALKRAPPDARLDEAARRAPRGSWTQRFAVEVGEAATEEARAGAANEALADLAHEIEATATWPGAAVRLSCFGALLLAAAALLLARTGAILPVIGIGATGALLSAELGRRARAAAKQRRAAADAFVDVVMPATTVRRPARGGTFRRARRQ